VLRKDDGKVTQPTNSYYAHFLAWTCLESDQGAVNGQSTAQHRRYYAGLQILWNLEREVFVRTDMAGVAAL
jgi:hypothetical protein